MSKRSVSYLAALCLFGCSFSADRASERAGSISAFIAPESDALSIEETTEEQARREVLSSPTHFVIPAEDDKEAWERASFFLENYSSPTSQKGEKPAASSALITSVVGNRWTIANPASSGAYAYQVSKQPMSKGGFRYMVACQPRVGGNKYQSSLNAANLSRFVREGRLEVSLLKETPQK